jgi:hypothetical protein
MKRIYLALALIGGVAFGAKAQSIDLEAIIALPAAGQTISAHENLDTSKVLAGIVYNGADAIFSGDGVYFMTSCSNPSTTPGSYYIDGVSFQDDITNADSGSVLFIYPNANEIGQGHKAPFMLNADSIHLMFDWNQWNNNDSIVVINPPFVSGTSYGFFFRAIDVRDDGGSSVATDPNPANNFAVQRIVWNSTSSIQEFAKKDKADISAYPNPATNVVNFDFNFDKASHAQVFVRDITGKVVYSKNYGRVNAGVQKFTADLSKLSAGNYVVELDTDTHSAVSKFTKK